MECSSATFSSALSSYSRDSSCRWSMLMSCYTGSFKSHLWNTLLKVSAEMRREKREDFFTLVCRLAKVPSKKIHIYWLHFLLSLSFFSLFAGSVYSIFGFGREKLECDDTSSLNYCRYSYPSQLIRDIGMQNEFFDCSKNSTINKFCDQNVHASQKLIFYKVIIVLILFIVFFRTLSYFIMRHRLKS